MVSVLFNMRVLEVTAVVIIVYSNLCLCQFTCKVFNNPGRPLTGYCNGISVSQNLSELPKDLQVLRIQYSYVGTLKNNTFEEFHQLKRLYISQNFVHRIEINSFSTLGELEVLDLSFNNLKIIGPHNIFFNNTKLKTLDLSLNPFLRFTLEEPFLTVPFLEELNLAYCQLTNLSPVSFSGLQNLRNLDLRGNYMHAVSLMNSINILPRLQSLNISEDFWLCDQNFESLKQWYNSKFATLNTSLSCSNFKEQSRSLDTIEFGGVDMLNGPHVLYGTMAACGFLVFLSIFLLTCLIVIRRRRLDETKHNRRYRTLTETPSVCSDDSRQTYYEEPNPIINRYRQEVERLPPAPPIFPTELQGNNNDTYLKVLPCSQCHEDMWHKVNRHHQGLVQSDRRSSSYQGYEMPVEFKCKCNEKHNDI